MAKVAIVTGSATGLGAACAVDLAGRGWNVAINYTKSKKEADETYAAVKAKGADAILVQADMGQDADCRKLAAETLKKWGRIDGLVNNAGTTKFQSQGDLDGVSAEDFDRILRVNVTGPYMMSRAVYPTMKKQWDDAQERGSIVNISSIAGIIAGHNMAAYNSAKAGVRHLSKSVALHCARKNYNIRSNSVHPVFIKTPILDGLIGRFGAEEGIGKLARQVPMGKIGEPDDIAYAVLYLASDESKFVTGAELKVDGGISAM